MAQDPTGQFIDAVKRSGLVSDAKLQETNNDIKSGEFDSQEEVADKLVENNVLTRYQAERIMAGKGADCVLAGRYHLLEPIGAGGMGQVFRAMDSRLDCDVAVKIMSAHSLSNPDAVARFQREAKALAHLNIPNVVKALDTGEEHGRHFLVMEFVNGVGLNSLVKERAGDADHRRGLHLSNGYRHAARSQQRSHPPGHQTWKSAPNQRRGDQDS